MRWLEHTSPVLLDPKKIDLDDRIYLIPCYQDMEPLGASIKRVGILNAPLLESCANNRLRPVLGRRRVRAAMSIGLTSIRADVISGPIPEADGFLLAFWDNIGHRTFDTATTAVVVRRLLQLFPREQAAEELLPLIGVPPKGPRIERLRALGTLEDDVLQALAHGKILEKTAAVLSELLPHDRRALLKLTQVLGLNANKSAEIIGFLFDLSVLHGKSVSDFVASPDAGSILENEDLTRPERTARFRALVRSWKFPELVTKEREFKEWLERLPRLDRVTVEPTQAFEDDKCAIRIATRSRSEAKQILTSLADARSEDPDPAATDSPTKEAAPPAGVIQSAKPDKPLK